jgi:hypothetical protein
MCKALSLMPGIDKEKNVLSINIQHLVYSILSKKLLSYRAEGEKG